RVDGRLNVRQFGGAGQDEISFHSDVDNASTGLVSVLLEGGDDDDTITYSAVGMDDPARTNVFIDGGTGFNIGKLSRNVMCVNLNDILWLPPLV
ncbi:MAG TPA: hypothetical protein PKA06_07645, partial [Gemmatales bacterium]|nr:hypothetical protein [Gemmatales bacterium]